MAKLACILVTESVMNRSWPCVAGVFAAMSVFAFETTAEAKPARCFSSDDGYYSCDFRGLDAAGSFRIRARGYPTYTINVDQPGFAYGFADFGTGNVSLPGQYVRSRDDGACWQNPETDTKICAW